KCRTKAEDILVLPLDVSQCDTHKDAVQTVLDKFDHIDILLNNAGRGMRAKWWEVDLKVDRELWELNVLGTVSLTHCVLPHMMKRRQGHVVAVSSLSGHFRT
ncbi:dehydrogenase/reductase sdr family member 7, partial [Plakobranchus ocellatus]